MLLTPADWSQTWTDITLAGLQQGDFLKVEVNSWGRWRVRGPWRAKVYAFEGYK